MQHSTLLFLTIVFVPVSVFIFLVRGCRPGKTVNLTENEIRSLCILSREVFLSESNLLELKPPIKICGAPALTFFVAV